MSDNRYYGLYQGIVTNINDPEKRGRIRVLCPDVLGDSNESAWCDPVSIVAYDDGGDFCIPKENEAVWVLFIRGEPNLPVYLGGWWSKDSTPLGKNYTGLKDIRVINYANCTITMKEDKIDISIEDSPVLTIRDNKVKVYGNLEVTGSIIN